MRPLSHSVTQSLVVGSCGLVIGLASARAQGQGQWVMAYDHKHAVPGVASDATTPFTYPGGPEWPVRLIPPDATAPPTSVASMNAIHMSLIPKGIHRGKVIVYGSGPSVAFAAPFPPAGNLWSFQPYSIVDPAIAPAGLRFLNFFLPLDSTTFPPPPGVVPRDLFCTGHAWSPFGYLVVVGGTRYVPGQPDNGADLVFTFDPRYQNAPFPSTPTGPSLYPDAGSLWTRESVTLTTPRYYPTATLTHRFPRVVSGQPPQLETMLVLGGSAVGGGVPMPEWNHYEALILTDLGPGNLQRVYRDTIAGSSAWWGPSDPNVTPYDPFRDSLIEYPRVHLLSNGQAFMSGYAAVSAQIDHSFVAGTVQPAAWSSPGTWTQSWNQAAGMPTAASPYREDGASVLIVNGTPIPDLVVRIGGEGPAGALTSVEICSGSTPGSWLGAAQGVPPLPNGREHPTAVLLPDLSIAVFGGHDGATSHLTPLIFKWGMGQWQPQPAAQSPRNYHATAALLPSGHVLVAGGNDRHPTPFTGFDYELFAPPYMVGSPPPARPTGVTIVNSTATQSDGTYELARNGTFSVLVNDGLPIDTKLEKLVLISPGSATHHSDMHQRYVECGVFNVNGTMMQFTLPTERQAPRGYYMAFVVTQTRIPSEAIWVWLN